MMETDVAPWRTPTAAPSLPTRWVAATNDCVTDIYTLGPCGFKYGKKKESGPFVLRYSVHGCPHQSAYLEYTPFSCLCSDSLSAIITPSPGKTRFIFILLLAGSSVWFKYTCVTLIRRGNSQCNHREYAINWESLQSIARRVYSYTSFAVFSSLCTLSLLQLPPLYFSSVLFSFAKCRLRSLPGAPAPSSVEKSAFLPRHRCSPYK